VGVGTGLSPIPSVGLSLCLVGELWKNGDGSGCHLGWWVGSAEEWVY